MEAGIAFSVFSTCGSQAVKEHQSLRARIQLTVCCHVVLKGRLFRWIRRQTIRQLISRDKISLSWLEDARTMGREDGSSDMMVQINAGGSFVSEMDVLCRFIKTCPVVSDRTICTNPTDRA